MRRIMLIMKEREISMHINVLDCVSPHGGGLNPFVGQTFAGRDVVGFPNLSSLLADFQSSCALGQPSIGIAHTRSQNFGTNDVPVMFSVECGQTSERESELFGKTVVFNQARVTEHLEAAMASADVLAGKTPGEQTSMFASSLRSEEPGHIYFIVASGLIGSAEGTGLGYLCMNAMTYLRHISMRYGYELYVLSENDLDKINPPRNSMIFGLSMNSIVKGGTGIIGQGYNLSNLLRMASYDLKYKPILVTSLHKSESEIYGTFNETEIASLNKIKFSAFNPNGLRFLEKAGFDITPEPWPVFIDENLLTLAGHTNEDPNSVQILFQMDTQHRKNGEYVLPALIDAISIAHEQRPALKIKLVMKATAAHAIASRMYLDDLLAAYPAEAAEVMKRVEIEYQLIVSADKWHATINTTDIGIFLSTEEGLHMFAAELWLGGAHCIISGSGVYPPYEKLENGITRVNTVQVPSAGTGMYNDSFLTNVQFPVYEDMVMKIADALLTKRRVARRYPKNDGPIATKVERMASLISLEPTNTSKQVDIHYLRDIYKPWGKHLK